MLTGLITTEFVFLWIIQHQEHPKRTPL